MSAIGTALVTGASSGIGKALAWQFAEHGYELVLVAQNEALLQEVATEIERQHGRKAMILARDLTDERAPAEIYEALRVRGIQIDVLVNDAGVGQRELFHETGIDKDVEIVRLNVEALLRLTKLFVGDMVARGSGRILNLGSVAGFQPGPLLAVYHASKAFVVSFSEALRDEVKDKGVVVTVLCPGPTDTGFFERADMEDARILHDGIVMEPEKVAAVAYDALMADEGVVIPGVSNKVMTFTRRLIPNSLQASINRKFYEVKTE